MVSFVEVGRLGGVVDGQDCLLHPQRSKTRELHQDFDVEVDVVQMWSFD